MKLGVMINDLGPSQLSYELIHQANALVSARTDLDIVAFYESLARPCLPLNFACMQVAEAFGYDGTVVATSLNGAAKLIRFPSPPRKLFYVWDLEWLRQPGPFRSLQAIYGHEQLRLLARSEDHARAISQCWNRPVAVIADFNLGRILEVAQA